MRSHAKAVSAGSTEWTSRRARPTGVLAAVLACFALFSGIGASAADAVPSAKPGWGFRASFDAPPVSLETVQNPIAIGGNGNIFLADQNVPAVRVFSPDPSAGGVPLTEVTALGYDGVRNVAVDTSDEALYMDSYTGNGRPAVINRYTSDGQPTPTYTIDPGFELPRGEGLAVDPTTHDLLVTEPATEAVLRYDTGGALLATIPTPVAPARITTLPDGSFYVASASGPDVVHLAGDGTVLGTIAGVGTVQGLAWDSTRNLLVASVGSQLENYSSAGSLLSESPAQTDAGTGLAIDQNAHLLYQASFGTAYVYAQGVVPGIEDPVISNLGAHSALLEAEVDPGEANPGHPEDGTPTGSKARFEYKAAGDPDWKPLPGQADQELSTPGPQVVEADLTGLLANFNYEVRLVASNSVISRATDAVPFATAQISPEVVTGSATDVGETSAVLNGAINPSGLQTTYYFEYGTTAAYGSRVPAGIDAVAGSERQRRAFIRTILDLQPGTEYHFRIVATNSVGVSKGADETFTTARAGDIIHRVYEQATPVDKRGVPIESTFGFYAKPDGNGIAYITKNGKSGSPLNARSVNLRGPDNWGSGLDLDPALNVYKTGVLTQATLGLSADFTRALVVSNRDLAPGGVEESANLYILDIASNSYTWVGVATPPNPAAFNTYTGFGAGGNLQASAPDFSWIVFYSTFPLIENAPFNALYRWSDADGLEVASVLPGPSETQASVDTPSAYETVHRTVSADGSRIYFTSEGPEPGVYLREGGETKAISISQVPGDPTTPQPGTLLDISKDGRYAFFASKAANPLTIDAPTPVNSQDGGLYRYDLSDGSLEYIARLFLATPGLTRTSGLGVSEDGGTIYFREGTQSGPHSVNVWHAGEVKDIATYPIRSEYAWMSPNGRYLAFPGRGVPEPEESTDRNVYLYDAATEEVSCASCLPDGSPGMGYLPNGQNRTIGEHISRAVTDAGQVFFTSDRRLVAADVNGVEDAYEFKDGKATLISPGNAPFPAIFADISTDASSVFFTTSQKLVGQDSDQTVDIYDARIGGGLSGQNPAPPQECLRDDCKATPSAGPEVPFGGSEALSGPGNVSSPARKRCGKGTKARKAKGKTRCVKKHKAKKSKKGGNR